MKTSIASKGFKPKTTNNNEWKNLPWGKIQRKVFKLQKAIYQAASRGNRVKARRLQRLLNKSYYARLLAVRKVTQDNQGKRTAGIDGVKSVKPKDRFLLAEKLKENSKAKSLRRIWIPKPGRDEKRPLGIPTIYDRAKQALVKLGLEPQWEALFEAESYGFRPGRSAHDAIDAIYKKCHKTEQFVLDADIAKCFDQINHDYLMSKLDCPSVYKRSIKQWLKAGVMDNGVFEATEAGTPQGGVISPLLANIALHGMIESVVNSFPRTKVIDGKREQTYSPKIIRYADDFVVLANTPEVVLEARQLIEEWLKPAGLQLKPEKTRLCNTLSEWNEEKPGFDFLGFNIRHYPVSIHKGVNTGRRIKPYQLSIKPSKKAVQNHYDACKEVIKRHRTAPQAALINKLNPIIRGWSRYYSTVISKETFSKLDHMIWNALRAWTVSRCGKASYEKLGNYFAIGKHGKWTFQTKDGLTLTKHTETSIKRHIKVKGNKTPYDGDWAYWTKRMSKGYGGISTRITKLIKRQKGRCNHCGQYFTHEDLVEIDHIQPKSRGGKNDYSNLQLLHRHCHDIKSQTDNAAPMTGDSKLGAV
ncbi:group II intron reverse transcriptase/maturase [Spirulina sp. CS-785/01]|uniref:group II intron reverse transcriptase/maturase n=1 Tax=Spirulina sp. CS-785/01 TaxID=3021716 RepID=UPI00233108EF|nr:group II intron reverse transcriptase/maturase [Spirulina sp. CS-785/01]MDB9314687.1 group II intron reverse transcriptase/maturase [Spirulina sp. CS-785/01]